MCPATVAQKCHKKAFFIVLFVLILCHVKKAYSANKKQKGAFLLWHYEEQEDASLKTKLTQSYYLTK